MRCSAGRGGMAYRLAGGVDAIGETVRAAEGAEVQHRGRRRRVVQEGMIRTEGRLGIADHLAEGVDAVRPTAGAAKGAEVLHRGRRRRVVQEGTIVDIE